MAAPIVGISIDEVENQVPVAMAPSSDGCHLWRGAGTIVFPTGMVGDPCLTYGNIGKMDRILHLKLKLEEKEKRVALAHINGNTKQPR